MANIEIHEVFDRGGSINETWERTYQRRFICTSDTKGVGPYTIGVALLQVYGIQIGVSYSNGFEFDTGALCNQIQAKCDTEDGLGWHVDVDYGKWKLQYEDPTQNPIEVTLGFEKQEEPVDFDKDGNAVCNSAGDPFDPTIKRPRTISVLTLMRNEYNYSQSLAEQYMDTVNSSPFLGADEFTVYCDDIAAQRDFNEFIGFFYHVTYRFMYKADGWDKNIVDMGRRELDDNGKIQDITEKGVRVSAPVLLDGDGHKLEVQQPPLPPVKLPFSICNEADFNDFDFNL